MKNKVLIFHLADLVPFLMGYKGWAIFMDCDMLCFQI